MKKVVAIIMTAAIFSLFTISAFAENVDDGKITVATKEEVKYFGTESVAGCVKYVAANGNGKVFYDLNNDKDMNVCDLVSLHKNEVDFNANNVFDYSDAETFRSLIIEEMNSERSNG